MAKPHYTEEKRICINPECEREYTALIASLFETKIVIGGGLCPSCRRKKDEEEKAKEQEATLAQIAHQRRQMRLSCGIDAKFQSEDFSTFKQDRQPKAFKKCWEYAEGFPISSPQGYHSLVLYSENSWGVGKTHLACAIGHRIYDRWKGEEIGRKLVLFVSEPDIYMRIQATFGYSAEDRHRETEADIIRQLTSPALLIIDDVGKRRVQDPRFVQRTMFSIIDGRYKAMLPIVLTANLSPDQLKHYLGSGSNREDEASFDRLTEMCGGRSGRGVKFFQLEGETYRRLK